MTRPRSKVAARGACGARSARALAAAITALAAAWPLAEAARAEPAAPAVPGAIAVEAGHKVFLVGHAVGVQIYACSAGADGARWALLAPRANLYDDGGHLVTTHFGGPTWQARDGSRVVGARDADVTVDPTAIPWLRLSAASTSAGEDGGRLAETTFIQRIATTGGRAPSPAACTLATVGTREEIPYTAVYVFWKAKRS